MHYLILGLLLLLLFYAGLKSFLNANSKNLAGTMQNIGGGALLVMALFFGATGRFAAAVPLGLFALTLLGRNIGGFNPFRGAGTKSTGQKSQVRTDTVEMELDHDTGAMEGVVLSGKFADRSLSSLSELELLELLQHCRTTDVQAAQLVEAYLDRMHADWRGDSKDETRSGSTKGSAEGPMSREDAFDILGLKPDASMADIRRAHRNLMKKLHPDQGGSTYLAARVNQAKDLLLD